MRRVLYRSLLRAQNGGARGRWARVLAWRPCVSAAASPRLPCSRPPGSRRRRAQYVDWRASVTLTGAYTRSVSDAPAPAAAQTYSGPSVAVSPARSPRLPRHSPDGEHAHLRPLAEPGLHVAARRVAVTVHLLQSAQLHRSLRAQRGHLDDAGRRSSPSRRSTRRSPRKTPRRRRSRRCLRAWRTDHRDRQRGGSRGSSRRRRASPRAGSSPSAIRSIPPAAPPAPTPRRTASGSTRATRSTPSNSRSRTRSTTSPRPRARRRAAAPRPSPRGHGVRQHPGAQLVAPVLRRGSPGRSSPA